MGPEVGGKVEAGLYKALKTSVWKWKIMEPLGIQEYDGDT